MENVMEGMAGILAIILSLGIPLIAIVMAFWAIMHKKSRDKEIRQLIIENNTDPESIKLLLDEPKKASKGKTTDMLNGGCILLGAGLGAFFAKIMYIGSGDIFFWLSVAAGMGIGMLVAFVIGWNLEKKNQDREQQS